MTATASRVPDSFGVWSGGAGPAPISFTEKTPLKRSALVVVARFGVGATLADVVEHTRPRFTGKPAEFRAWRAGRDDRDAKHRKQVSQALRRLAYDGLITGRGPLALDPAERDLLAIHGVERFRRGVTLVRNGHIEGWRPLPDSKVERFRRVFVLALADHPEGLRRRALFEAVDGLTESGSEKGSAVEALRTLMAERTVIGADASIITDKGRDALKRWGLA